MSAHLTQRGHRAKTTLKVVLVVGGLIALYCILNVVFGVTEVQG